MRENIALRQKHKNWRTVFFIEKKYCGTIIAHGGPMFVAFVGNPCPCTRKKGYPQTLTPTKTTGKEWKGVGFLLGFFICFLGFLFVLGGGGSCYLFWLTVVDMWLREGSNRLRSWSTLGSTDSKLMRSFKRLSTCQI